MKIKIMFSFVLLLFVGTNMYAGFPVTRTVNTSENVTITVAEEDNAELLTSPAATAGKDRTTALLLWFFLGGFAAHRWYLGSPWGWNLLYIFTFGFLFVGHIIDLIDIITEKYPGL